MEMKRKRICLICMTMVSEAPAIRHTIVPLLWEEPKITVLKESEFQKKKEEQNRKHFCLLEMGRQTVYIYVYSTNASLLLYFL